MVDIHITQHNTTALVLTMLIIVVHPIVSPPSSLITSPPRFRDKRATAAYLHGGFNLKSNCFLIYIAPCLYKNILRCCAMHEFTHLVI